MAEDDDEIPEYLRSLPAPSEDELWKDIADRFFELVNMLRSVRLETKEQAIHQRQGMKSVDRGVYWDDPDAGVRTRSWLQIPYDPDREIGDFQAVWETALVLAEQLKPKIAARELSIETLSAWGAFCGYASIVEHEYLRNRPNLQHLKGAEAQRRDQHKIWFSHLFMHLRREGDTREVTEGRVLAHLYAIFERAHFPNPDFQKEWFQEFEGRSRTRNDKQERVGLAASFVQNKLTFKEIKRLAQESLDDLPPLDW